MEENLPPGFQLPCFSSWTASQSVQANSYSSAPLAPRTGHEQPYWYWPPYEGWQYVTGASKVTQQASFHHSSSTCRFKHHRSMGCHAMGCHAIGCHAMGCHAMGYHTMGCHAVECHATGNQVTDYYSKATENAQSSQIGVAYDQKVFPKIISVHSMGKESCNTLRKASYFCGEERGNTPNYLFCKSSVAAPKSCYNDAESSIKITDHSISTILDLPSTKNCSSLPDQNDALVGSPTECDCPRNETKVSLPSDEHDQGIEVRYSMAKDGEIKIKDCAINCPNFAEGLSNSALQRQKGNSTLEEVKAPEMARESTLQKSPVCITPLKIKKNTLSLHRLREINKVQKRLKREWPDCNETRFIEKIEMRREEIKNLSNGSLKSNQSASSESLFNSPPDKRSLQATYKKNPERNESMADSGSDRKSLKLNVEITAEKSLGDTLSSEKLKEEVPEDGFRMNVFEKLALLSEKRWCTDSTFCSSSLDDSNTQSSDPDVKIKETYKRRNDQIIESKDELYALRFNSKGSTALENVGKLSENIDILVKSEKTSYADTATGGTFPNSWSSAYIYENMDSKSNSDVLKRKRWEGMSGESTKRHSKSLPRKLKRTVADSLDKEPLLRRKNEEKDEEPQDILLKTEVSCKGENVDATLFQGIVNRNDDADKTCLSSSPLSQSSIASDANACWVYDDDLLQRSLELRQSKINNLLRKQEGLLEKLGSTPLPRK